MKSNYFLKDIVSESKMCTILTWKKANRTMKYS